MSKYTNATIEQKKDVLKRFQNILNEIDVHCNDKYGVSLQDVSFMIDSLTDDIEEYERNVADISGIEMNFREMAIDEVINPFQDEL
jgi:replicative DNA helicase